MFRLKIFLTLFLFAISCPAGLPFDPFDISGDDRHLNGQEIDLLKFSNEELLSLNDSALVERLEEMLEIEYQCLLTDLFFVEDHLTYGLRRIARESASISIREKALELLSWLGDVPDFEPNASMLLGNSLEKSIESYIQKKAIVPKSIEVEMLNRKFSKACIRIEYTQRGYLGGSTSSLCLVKHENFWYLTNETPLKTTIGL